MNLSVDIAGVTMKNPVTTGSGTFGSGEEFSEFVDLSKLGAVTTKGVANVPWPGNSVPRVAEVYGGMLNAIGLQNPGIDVFVERDIPYLKKAGATIIVNVCGKSEKDYLEVVERLADQPVDLLEINVSCPNVKEGGIAFGQNPNAAQLLPERPHPILSRKAPTVKLTDRLCSFLSFSSLSRSHLKVRRFLLCVIKSLHIYFVYTVCLFLLHLQASQNSSSNSPAYQQNH